MTSKKLLITAITLGIVISPLKSEAVERLSINPGGVVLYGTQNYSGVVMSAYQQPYAMNFDIWKPNDLPAGWYATFDGFPVAQVAENRWVYGQLNIDGAIRPTNVLVGSVIPTNIPGLVRIASVWSYGRAIDSAEFTRIQKQRCDRMGWLYFPEEYVNTLIAWNTRKVGVWIWLGNRWRRFEPQGEYTWRMIKRLIPYIAEELRKNHAWYQGGEPLEAADLARQWGMIWGGRVVIEKLKSYPDKGDSSTVTSLKDDASGNNDTGPQENVQTYSGPQWDVE